MVYNVGVIPKEWLMGPLVWHWQRSLKTCFCSMQLICGKLGIRGLQPSDRECPSHYWQRCPKATAHGDFASYLCPMRHLLFQNFMYSAVTSIVNVVIFAAYSSQCAVYFEKCGQRCYWGGQVITALTNSILLDLPISDISGLVILVCCCRATTAMLRHSLNLGTTIKDWK